jgi:hypothetical protein
MTTDNYTTESKCRMESMCRVFERYSRMQACVSAHMPQLRTRSTEHASPPSVAAAKHATDRDQSASTVQQPNQPASACHASAPPPTTTPHTRLSNSISMSEVRIPPTQLVPVSLVSPVGTGYARPPLGGVWPYLEPLFQRQKTAAHTGTRCHAADEH